MELAHPPSDDSLHAYPAVDATLARAHEVGTASSSRSGSTTLRDEHDAHVEHLNTPSRSRGVVGRVIACCQHGRELVFSERISVLLVFVPVGITVGFLEAGAAAEFILNALAIIPLAVVISTATEILAGRLGDTFGALLNVTVGNTAELIIFYVALRKNQIRIVQASLLGSVVTNLLLILGTALLAGGLRFRNEMRDRPAVRLSVALLDLGLLLAMYPIAFWVATTNANQRAVKAGVLAISRGTSIGLIVIYLLYLTFQMRSQASSPDGETQIESVPLSELHPSGSAPRSRQWKTGRYSEDEPRDRALRNLSATFNRWPRWFAREQNFEPLSGSDKASDASRSLLRQTVSAEDLAENEAPPSQRPEMDARASPSGSLQSGVAPARQDSRAQQILESRAATKALSWISPRQQWATAGEDEEAEAEEEEEARGRPLLSTEDAASQSFPAARAGLEGQLMASRNGVDPRLIRRNTFKDLYEHRRSRSRQSKTPLAISIIVLIAAAALASICSEFAVDAIPSIVESAKISQIFIGFVVLPVVGNAAEHVTAAKLAMHDKFVLAKSVAIESSTQVVLLITPAMVLLGWLKNRELTMHFDIYEIASVVIASVVASFVASCGRGDWKQGVLLYTIFFMIAIGAVLHPSTPKLYGRQGF